ncbi:uncharacterized protein ACBT44_010089 isoform 1-T1 [Syngnathus typhle]
MEKCSVAALWPQQDLLILGAGGGGGGPSKWHQVTFPDAGQRKQEFRSAGPARVSFSGHEIFSHWTEMVNTFKTFHLHPSQLHQFKLEATLERWSPALSNETSDVLVPNSVCPFSPHRLLPSSPSNLDQVFSKAPASSSSSASSSGNGGGKTNKPQSCSKGKVNIFLNGCE